MSGKPAARQGDMTLMATHDINLISRHSYRMLTLSDGHLHGENIRVDVYQGQNGQSITLELLNAKIGFATSGNSQQQQSSNHQNHPEYDDSIPF